MLGYILAIIAVVVVVPLVFLLLRGRRAPGPTAAQDSRAGTIRQEPAREQVESVGDAESINRPSSGSDRAP